MLFGSEVTYKSVKTIGKCQAILTIKFEIAAKFGVFDERFHIKKRLVHDFLVHSKTIFYWTFLVQNPVAQFSRNSRSTFQKLWERSSKTPNLASSSNFRRNRPKALHPRAILEKITRFSAIRACDGHFLTKNPLQRPDCDAKLKDQLLLRFAGCGIFLVLEKILYTNKETRNRCKVATGTAKYSMLPRKIFSV